MGGGRGGGFYYPFERGLFLGKRWRSTLVVSAGFLFNS